MQSNTLRKTRAPVGFSVALFSAMLTRHCLLSQTPEEEDILNKKRSKKVQKKFDKRRKNSKISPLLDEQFQQGKLLGKACIPLTLSRFISQNSPLVMKLYPVLLLTPQ